MKAILFCSGNDSGLMPMNSTIPKALLHVCGKEIIKYMMDTLNNYDVEEAIIVTDGNVDLYKRIFPDSEYKNIRIGYADSKGMAELDVEDDVIFAEGAVLFSFDINGVMDFDTIYNPFATVIGKPVNSVKNMETIVADKDNKVELFLNRQSNSGKYNGLANTNIWMVSKTNVNEFLRAYISKGKISPKNYRVSVYKDEGYWNPLYNVKDFLKANRDLLSLKAPFEFGAHRMLGGIASGDFKDYGEAVQISPPVYIGKNVAVGEGTVIEGYSVIEDNVTIGKNVKIYGGFIMEGAYLGDRSECIESAVCPKATVLSGVSVNEGCIVGENAVIGENSVIESGVKVWNGKHIEKNTVVSFDVRYANAQYLDIGEDGICGETGGEISAFSAVRIGMSLVNAGKSIVLGYKADSGVSRCFAMAVCAGISSAGGDVMLIDECIETELAYITRECRQDLGVYIEGDSVTKVKLISKDGLSLDRASETAVEAGLDGEVMLRAPYFAFGRISEASHLKQLYEIRLREYAAKSRKYNFDVSTSNRGIKKLCASILKNNSSPAPEKMVFQISSDGKKASVYTVETGFVFYEKLVAICCRELFEKGYDAAIPYSFSMTIDEVAKAYGRKAMRYHDYCESDEEKNARELAGKLEFLNDGMILMLNILRIMSEKDILFSELVKSVPQTFISSRFISCQDKSFDFIKQISDKTEFRKEGVWIKDKKGEVYLRPSKSGNSIRVFAESFSSETASELCDSLENIIKNKLLS